MLPDILLAELSLIEQVELSGVLGGKKPIMRFCRNLKYPEVMRDLLGNVGVALVDPNICFVSDIKVDGYQSFGHCIRGAASSVGTRVYYAMLKGNEQVANSLCDLEIARNSDEPIGKILGIPKCCRTFYSSVGNELNWFSLMVKNTDLSSPCFKCCNQFAREFLGATLKPDYFPCSFQCSETRRLSTDYRPLIERYLGKEMLQDLDLLCGMTVDVGEFTARFPDIPQKTYPIGLKGLSDISLVFC